MTVPLVSIIIPNYNRADLLRRALQSVVTQTFTDWEAIIIDNHSEENIESVVHSFQDGRIRLLKIHNHGIIAASRNLGIREAQGIYLAFLDSDDWWKPNKLEVAVPILEAGQDIVYHNLIYLSSSGKRWFFRPLEVRPLNSPVYQDLIENGNTLPNSSVMVRRQLMLQVGGFSEDPELVAAEDYECWLRLSQITERFASLSEALGYYWMGAGMTSAKRSLTFLQTLEKLHFRAHQSRSALPLWAMYAKGRAHYVLKEFSEASAILAQIPLTRISKKTALKIIYMRLALKYWY